MTLGNLRENATCSPIATTMATELEVAVIHADEASLRL
jgi:hypothetical protein